MYREAVRTIAVSIARIPARPVRTSANVVTRIADRTDRRMLGKNPLSPIANEKDEHRMTKYGGCADDSNVGYLVLYHLLKLSSYSATLRAVIFY